MMATHEKSASKDSDIRTTSTINPTKITTTNPKSVAARLSAGMIPFFVPPPPHLSEQSSSSSASSSHHNASTDLQSQQTSLQQDPTMMTPPMSPTEDHFVFNSTIDSRLATNTHHPTSTTTTTTSITTGQQSFSLSAHGTSSMLSPVLVNSPRTEDMTGSSTFESVSSPSTTASGSTTAFSHNSGISPRPLSFHWDDYRGDDKDEEEYDSYGDESDSQNDDQDRDNDEEKGYGDFDRSFRKGRNWDQRNKGLQQHPPSFPQKGDHIISSSFVSSRRTFNSDNIVSSNGSLSGSNGMSRSRRTSLNSNNSRTGGRIYQHQQPTEHGFEDEYTFGGASSYRGGINEDRYDSLRHGIGTSVSDMSEELAKARSKMNRASRAMRNMEQELETLQLSIDESKATSANARSALEENFWKLECLALTMEKDRQEMQKQIQTVGRETNQAVDTVTNWEVRIDWLGQKMDNTSEYVSELVLSEQECMSFVKMIIQQNRRYAMPAISRSTERNIKLMAPPTPMREIGHPSLPSPPTPRMQTPQPQSSPALASAPQHPPQRLSGRLGNIPLSWLLEPILPPKPPSIGIARIQEIDDSQDHQDEEWEHLQGGGYNDENPSRKRTVEPPAELWRDFSRLTVALEKGQTRTPFSPFQRARSRNGPGILSSLTQATSGSVQSSSSSPSSPSNQGNVVGFKSTVPRRPQVEGLTAMPKILPASAAVNRIPDLKRRSKNLSHLPVHSWLQFQFSKTMTNPGALTMAGATGGSRNKSNNNNNSTTKSKPITIFQTIV
ncbi:hypothetical protein BGZ83_003532 [Gryganskiella cystojenkinii]|nr:hypothetical protein BGZ83_003532 [Gryganskiella cystojenkinii]